MAAKYIQVFIWLFEAKGMISQPRSEGQLGRNLDGTTSVSTATVSLNRYAINTMMKMATNMLKSLKVRRSCVGGEEAEEGDPE